MIPNILTTVRLVLVPAFAYFMLSGDIKTAVVLFILSGITDVVDGYIARRFNMITNFGMVYDPFVDKLMQITAVVCLALRNTIPLWILMFVLLKEVTMIVIGGVLYIRKIVVHSNKFGKVATVIFYTGVVLLIIWDNIPRFAMTAVVTVMIVSMLTAAVYYCIDTLKNYDEKRV